MKVDRLLDETEASSESSKLVLRFLLHQVEAHRDQRQTTQQIETAHDVILRAPMV